MGAAFGRATEKGGAAKEKVTFSLLFDIFSLIFGFWATGRPYLAEDFLSTFQNYPKCVRRPLAEDFYYSRISPAVQPFTIINPKYNFCSFWYFFNSFWSIYTINPEQNCMPERLVIVPGPWNSLKGLKTDIKKRFEFLGNRLPYNHFLRILEYIYIHYNVCIRIL